MLVRNTTCYLVSSTPTHTLDLTCFCREYFVLTMKRKGVQDSTIRQGFLMLDCHFCGDTPGFYVNCIELTHKMTRVNGVERIFPAPTLN